MAEDPANKLPGFRKRDWSGMSHKEIVAKQRGELKDLIGSHHAQPTFDDKKFEENDVVAQPVEAGTTNGGVEEEGDPHEGEERLKRDRGLGGVIGKRVGSSVYLEPTANQNAQETLRTVPQPRHRYDPAGEPVIEWEIKRFVWWSEFLKKLPRAYLELLQLLNIDKEDYRIDYSGFYRYLHTVLTSACPVESIFVLVVNSGRYHPYTSVKHRRRASVRALDRLEFLEEECRKRRVKFDYVIKLDLTLPKQVSRRWDNEDVERGIRNAVQDFLTELHNELFPKKTSVTGAIANHHYWATKTPLEPHRHVHLTIPNVCYNKRTDMFHRFKPFIDVKLLRAVWKRVLVKNGLWTGDKDKEADVFVGCIKFDNREKVLHRLSYCCRKPVEDLVLNLNVNDLNDFDGDFALFLLDYTPRRINLGFLTNLKRFGYSRKPTPFRCPICGCEMRPELNRRGDKRLYTRPPPGILHLFQDRKSVWRETIDLATR